MKRSLLLPIILIFTFSVCFGQEYRSIEIVHPQGTFHQSGLNSQGQLCGSVLVDNLNFINHALRYEPDGSFTMLTLGDDGESATASDMNDLGHVIGTIQTDHFTSRYVVWESPTEFRELEQPDGFFAIFLKDLNNKGEAVGHTATTPVSDQIAFFWDAEGNLQELPQPGNGAEAIAINDHCQIVGRVYDADENSMPVLWEPVSSDNHRSMIEFELITLGSLGGNAGRANDINNHGQIVGFSAINDSINHAFFWEDGEIIDVASIGSTNARESGEKNSTLNAINNRMLAGGSWDLELAPEVKRPLAFIADLGDQKSTCDGKQLFSSGQAIPSEITYLSDRNRGYGVGLYLIPNFEVLIDKAASNSESGSTGQFPFSNHGDATNFLNNHWNMEMSKMNIYYSIKSGDYSDETLQLGNWSENRIVLESTGQGSTVLEGLIDAPQVFTQYNSHAAWLIKTLHQIKGSQDLNGSVIQYVAETGEIVRVVIEERGELIDTKGGGRIEITGSGQTYVSVKSSQDRSEYHLPSFFINGEVEFATSEDTDNEISVIIDKFIQEGGIARIKENINTFQISDDIEIREGEMYNEAQLLIEGIFALGAPSEDDLEVQFLVAFYQALGGDMSVFDDIMIGPDADPAERNANSNARGTTSFDPEKRNRFFLNGGTLKCYRDYAFEGTGDRFDDLEYLPEEQGLQGEVWFSGDEQQNVSHRSDEDAYFNHVRLNGTGGIMMQSDLTQNNSGTLNLDQGKVYTNGWNWTMLNPGFELDLVDRNSATEGMGVIIGGSRQSYVSGTISRVISSVTPESGGYLFPIGGKVNSVAYFRPLIIQVIDEPEDLLLVSSRTATLGELSGLNFSMLEVPGVNEHEVLHLNTLVGELTWQLKMEEKNSRNIQNLSTNIRFVADGIEDIEDPNLYRILRFDCMGNLIGEAGTFLPSENTLPTTAMHTGFIDSVFSISYELVSLDSCSYFVLAKGDLSTAIEDISGLDQGFKLMVNNPNPFQEVTEISYRIPRISSVRLTLHNGLGQPVRTLVNSKNSAGAYSISWDGKSDNGQQMPPGVYYYRMEFGDSNSNFQFQYAQTHKMVLVR